MNTIHFVFWYYKQLMWIKVPHFSYFSSMGEGWLQSKTHSRFISFFFFFFFSFLFLFYASFLLIFHCFPLPPAILYFFLSLFKLCTFEHWLVSSNWSCRFDSVCYWHAEGVLCFDGLVDSDNGNTVDIFCNILWPGTERWCMPGLYRQGPPNAR